jgi:hypothetical protein
VLGNGANVGIGTSSPTARLHVATGEANISGLRLENLTSASPASASGQGKFLTVDGSGNVILANVNGSGRQVANGWEANGEYLQSTNLGGVIVGQGIDKTPAGYNLFVSKGILTEKVKVAVKNTADWSDYVFTKRYKLRSLTEVEQFISQHKHLPGVPSANEVVKQGLDVATMDAKLLEKVEELTLYTIQLEKANQKQQQEIDELKNLVKQLLQKR